MAISKVWKMGAATGSLEFIPAPGRDIDRTPIWNGAIHVSVEGDTTQDILGARRHSWNLSWSYLTPTEFLLLKKYWDGTVAWPFRLLDPRADGGTFIVMLTAPPMTSIQLKDRFALAMSLRETSA